MIAIQLLNRIEHHPEQVLAQAEVIMQYRVQHRREAQADSHRWLTAIRNFLRRRSAQECNLRQSTLNSRSAC